MNQLEIKEMEQRAPLPLESVLPPGGNWVQQENADGQQEPNLLMQKAPAPAPQSRQEQRWPAAEEQREPIPLESLTPLPVVNTGRELEKGLYWNSLLSGNLDEVPDAVRQKAGAGDQSLPADEREYRLMSNINRSWMVDHRDMSREQVRSSWPELRQQLTRELGVGDTEAELYTALSLQNQETPVREKVRRLYSEAYQAALSGQEMELPEDDMERQVCREAMSRGLQNRAEYLPLAEEVSEAWGVIKAQESNPVTHYPDFVMGMPGLLKAVDGLADMSGDERARVYAVARSLDSTKQLEEKPAHLGEAMLHSMRRGSSDLGHAALQGIGHLATAVVNTTGKAFESEGLQKLGAAADKRLQTLAELRRVAQGELFPIDLGEESGLMEQMAVDAAGALPGAVAAFAGFPGFALLTLSGTGAAVAEARERASDGRQELQTAAGILGAALQGAIYMGMSRVGAQLLSRTINNFIQASGSGVKGYSLAALKGVGNLTAETAKLLMAGKAAHATELGMQELAAHVDNVASNIDWKSFGDNFVDIEANMREAAMNLPFVLIAAGRASLHHFRNPSALLENGELGRVWKVDEEQVRRILAEKDVNVQTRLLQDALCNSVRWGGTGALELFIRSLKLLNTSHHTGFKEEAQARDFLHKRADYEGLSHPRLQERNMQETETVLDLTEQASGRRVVPMNTEKALPYLRLYDEWFQKGNGELMRNQQEAATRANYYKYLIDHRFNFIPTPLKLDGIYNPFREAGIRTLFNDIVVESRNLSYQSLLNMETLDSMRRSYKSADSARKVTDARRNRLISEMCCSVVRCLEGMPLNASMGELCEKIGKMYMDRRRSSACAPNWLRKVTKADYTNCYEVARANVHQRHKDGFDEKTESYRNILGYRACAEALLQIIPHLGDYQEVVSMGYSPKDGYVHLLNREFGDMLDPAIWKYGPITSKKPNKGDNQYRLNKYQKDLLLYSDLSGYNLESCADVNGKTLWRMKRPDGRYTNWYKAPGYAVNAMVGNVETSFLPMGKNELLTELQKGYVRNEVNKVSYDRRRVFSSMQPVPLEFDHLGRTAMRDLCARWLGDSTLYASGVEFARSNKNWKRYRGSMLDRYFKRIEDDSDRYLVRFMKPLTPLSLARIRFTAYWHRLLNSGWVSPLDVCNLLVENKIIHSAQRDRILHDGLDRKVNYRFFSGPVRREFLRDHPEGIVAGDASVMNMRLSRHMAELNLRYMLAHLPESRLPDSAKQWFLTTPFCNYDERRHFIPNREKVTKASREDAMVVKRTIPVAVALRRKYSPENPMPLDYYLKAAYEPSDSMRQEQGWCYALGGSRTFISAGQSFWNLLENPARGWKLLPSHDQADIGSRLQEFLDGRSPEAAMKELSTLLETYPELHQYCMPERHSSSLSRLIPDPVQTVDIAEATYTRKAMKKPYHHEGLKKGYTLEQNVELPAHMQNDERVKPAIRILSELRRSVARVPYMDDEGIWWSNERYGGKDGSRPKNIDENWTAETGLQTFLDFFQRVSEQVESQPLEACGVPLAGIRPGELDASRLRHVTVYRSSRTPEQMVRLMPGQPGSDNSYQRVPYVVHTSDGIPLLPESKARNHQERLQAMIPLNHFDSKMERMYDYKSNRFWRRKQVENLLSNLLKERTVSPDTWAVGDEMRVSNEELIMQLFQDSRLPYYLSTREARELTRGEAITIELARRLLLAEFGVERETHVQNLVDFCEQLRGNPWDTGLIKKTLDRIVSPQPERYSPEELMIIKPDAEINLPPHVSE